MESPNNHTLEPQEEKSIKEYLQLIRKNIILFLAVWILVTVGVGFYAYKMKNIYQATAMLKLSEPQASVLSTTFLTGLQSMGEDRFIANELEILKSYRLREKVAEAVIDSFKVSGRKNDYSDIVKKDESFWDETKIKDPVPYEKDSLTNMLVGFYEVSQKRGLDIVEITASSQSPYEASMLANIIAESYYKLNRELNKQFLSMDRKFLGEQKNEKMKTLSKAEQELEAYQNRTGIISLPEQSTALIDLLSDYESKKNAAQIELTISENSLKKYKEELSQQDPMIQDYLESFATEPYIKSLQEQIAKLESQKDLAVTISSAQGPDSRVIAEFDSKIKDLKEKLTEKINIYKAGIFASSPEEIKLLTQKILEEEVKAQAVKASLNEWSDLVSKYENKFNKLPVRGMDLARLEREKRANEKLYLLLEEKYQEAQIQEQSIPGNVIIIDEAREPLKPAKPNRKNIALVGIAGGFGLAFGLILIINFFDTKVRTPEQIQKNNFNYVSYIPTVENVSGTNGGSEVIYRDEGQSIAGEAFRTLRTRIRFARVLKKDLKLILITSPNQSEGKTFIACNLASSFALSNQKTLLVDIDLRKPRVHKFYGKESYPGIADFFLNEKKMSEIIRNTGKKNLQYITAGTLPPNPSELIASSKMFDVLSKLKLYYDIIIIDSAPLLAVSDSEVLTRYVDATYLVVNAGATEIDSMRHAVDILQYEDSSFKGVILNRFTPQKGDYYYYRYSYNYNYFHDSKMKKED